MSSTALESIKKQFGQTEKMIVRAGAGAGKTTELVNRVLGIAAKHLELNQKYPKLVVTTFTRKATQELRERLMKKAMELAEPSLIEFVQKESCLHISTIHGVLSLFLSRFGARLGLTPHFTFIDKVKEEKMIKKIIRRLLAQKELAHDLEILLEEQSLPNLMEAFIAFIENSSETSDIRLVDEQTLFAAIQKEDHDWICRAEELIGYSYKNETSEKWMAYCQRLSQVVSQLKKSNLKSRQSIYSHFDQNKERVSFKKGTDEDTKELKESLHKDAKSMANSFVNSEQAIVKHQALGQAFLKIAKLISTQLFEAKITSAQMTMGDLESFSLELIRKFPDTAKGFSDEWDYWLVDEYQDTSPRQVELLRSLIGTKNSFTVGDPQQSIYLFRGARSEVFVEKEKDTLKAGGKLSSKMENYRSRPELLNFFNHFFTQLGPQFQNMTPTEKTVRKDLEHLPAAIYFPTSDAKDADEWLEYEAVLSRIQELLSQNVSAEKICVLSRTNQELDILSKLAAKIQIPVQVHASAKFYLRREVQDALALLKFLANPADNVNLIKLLRSPWFKVADSELLKICHHHDSAYWLETKKIFGTTQPEAIVRLQLVLDKMAAFGISFAWVQGLQECGLLDTAGVVDPTRRREANLWKLIYQLRAEERSPGFNYLEFSERTEAAMQSLESQSDSDATPVEEPKRVNLMTIHASKGLQFDHVIIPFMGKINLRKQPRFYIYDEKTQRFSISLVDPDEGKLSATAFGDQILEITKDREYEEYDRLLYVAMTRAKLDVTLIWSNVRKNSWADRMWKPTANEFNSVYISDFKGGVIQNHSNVSEVNEGKQPKKELKKLDLGLQKKFPSIVSVTSLITEGKTFENKEVEGKTQTNISRLGARATKAQSGVAMHRLFESLKYRDLNRVDELATQAKEVKFLRDWNQGQILNWIRAGEVEWGFCLEQDQKWVQGQIDLWAIHDNQLWVVDYKTGSEFFKEMALQQLNLYAWALKKMNKAPNLMETHLVVIYPHLEKVHIQKATAPHGL